MKQPGSPGRLMQVFWMAWLAGSLGPYSCNRVPRGPEVVAVYPSADRLPENLLRCYIHFSEPMVPYGNLERIALYDDQGIRLNHVFFDNTRELWNREQTQLTLILDPARVKTGLQAHESAGRALLPGSRYRLVVSGMENVKHVAMDQTFEKSFEVAPADLEAPDIGRWTVASPPAGRNDPLIIHFPDMLDRLSLLNRLSIRDWEGHEVQGTATIGGSETEWSFHPQHPWKKGSYTLRVNARLEDPAGNNLNGLFDHRKGSLNYSEEGQELSLSFTISDRKTAN